MTTSTITIDQLNYAGAQVVSTWIKERGLGSREVTNFLMEGLDAFEDEKFASRLLDLNSENRGSEDIKSFKNFLNEELDHSLDSLLRQPSSRLCYDLGLTISVLHEFVKASAAA